MKCREKKCNGLIVLYSLGGIRKFLCNKCFKEYFVYRYKKIKQRMEV